jgi:hypothetical protein
MDYRIRNINSNEVLGLHRLDTLSAAIRLAVEIGSHESEPEVRIERLIDGEWIPVFVPTTK